MSIRKLVSTVVLFLGFIGFWYLYNKGGTLALFPIALPVYLFLLTGFDMQFVILALFLYSVILVFVFSKIVGRRRFIFAVIGALFVVHLLCLQLTVRAFERLGAGIAEQMLEDHKSVR